MTLCHGINTFSFRHHTGGRRVGSVEREQAGVGRYEAAHAEVKGTKMVLEIHMRVLAAGCLGAVPGGGNKPGSDALAALARPPSCPAATHAPGHLTAR